MKALSVSTSALLVSHANKPCARHGFHDEAGVARDERQAFGPSGCNIRHGQRLDE
jgi:hypothetical protein